MAKHYGAYSVSWFADRVTVILDPAGSWVLTYPVSSTKNHPEEVLQDITAILEANP